MTNLAVCDDRMHESVDTAFDWTRVREILGRHDVLRKKSAATPWEGLVKLAAKKRKRRKNELQTSRERVDQESFLPPHVQA